MSPERRRNFQRLLRPRHVALIGGQDAVTVAGECARIGFEGRIWPVNPRRAEIGGHPCFASVSDLPEAPDAAFLAVPREPAIEALRELSAMGAGGVVCYTAGFGELGHEGHELEDALIEAAGDMALVGPNCYGLINYVGRVALWPFAHGGFAPGYGAAIITQSGMLSSDLTMSQRTVPLAYMISAGNQAVLALEDFVDALCEEDEVRAIGLHIEGLQDVSAFAAAAHKALEAGKPIVALKTGSSEVGGRLTESHTGSLSGTDELYSALFDKLGVIRVHSPAQLLETLKFLTVAGVPAGAKVAGFTCSGGGATMLADHAEKVGLEFSQPTEATAERLKSLLPHTATVSNPLDYTTPIWGDRERVPPVFEAHLQDGYDAAVIVQDYPLPGLDESKPFYLNDAHSFVETTSQAGIPAAVCATLPENLDRETGEWLVTAGVAPMQGINECLDAMSAAAWYGAYASSSDRSRWLPQGNLANSEQSETLHEGAGKELLRAAGLHVPDGAECSGRDAAGHAHELGYPVVLKMLGPRLLHKTEFGAVAVGLKDRQSVDAAVVRMVDDVRAKDPQAVTDNFLVERMQREPVAELLLSLRRDPQFGLALTLASGGILVELVSDAATVLLPATDSELRQAISRLKVSRLLEGYRSKPSGDRNAIVSEIQALAALMADRPEIAEIEINPLFVFESGVSVVDVLMTRAG
ncbi:MAG: acetate--CoA ligase family protein [Pseudomonadota bacterium]